MSSVPRLFVLDELRAGTTIQATEAQAHYLSSVVRRQSGDDVVLFNGRDGEWSARLGAFGKRVTFEVAALRRAQEKEPDIWLAFAPLKRQATDLVVQKATELGAARLLPVITERTQSERTNPARWALIATEAAEQSERLSLPVIAPLQGLAELLAAWPAGRALLVAAERSTAPRPRRAGAASGLLVGPEGGFTTRELDALCAHPFVEPVSLGPRILRAETAAIVGLALLLLSA